MAAMVGRSGIFQAIDPAVAAELTTQLAVAHFAGRQQIFVEGQRGDQLYIVISGMVGLGHRCPDRRSHLLAIAGPSDIFGELSLFDPAPRAATATALTEVDVVAVDRQTFQTWIAEHPRIAERLLRMLARRMRRTEDDLCDLISTDVAGRVAKHLLRLSHRFGVQDDGAVRVTHNLTQADLAQLVGACRETVNKVLADFAGNGWIRLDTKSILITESESLVHRTRREANLRPTLCRCGCRS
ncbi:MAG: Crp/Fnr family transcriptional regulator [Mycobacterium sp.]|nr:Crp/Fnr family transcriptional regulator [Mycobacterium sp.]